jgi:tetratricopeptide (TPR) repeat protein
MTTPSESKVEQASGSTKMHKSIIYMIIGLIFLLPLFVLPNLPISFVVTKAYLIALVAILGTCFWIISRMQEGRLEIPRTYIMPALGFLIIVTTVSAFLFSRSVGVMGSGIEAGTAHMLLAFSVILLLIALFFKTRTSILIAFGALMLSSSVLAIFQIVRLFFRSSFLPGLASTFSPLGSWTDLGIYFGFIAFLVLIALEYLDLGKRFKVLLIALFAVSLFLVAVVNLSMVWFLVGIFGLIFLVYSLVGNSPISKKSDDSNEYTFSKSSLSIYAFILIIAAFVCIVAKNVISDINGSLFAISFVEIRPSWSATFDLFKSLTPVQYLLGVGPGNFVSHWLLNKPAGVHNSVVWATDFSYGVGFIPSAAITIGAVGFLAWIAFFAALITKGFTSLFRNRNTVSRFYIVSTFFGALYLWTACIIYVPGLVLISLAFIFTGLFIAVLLQEKIVKEKVLYFTTSPRALSFFLVISVIVLLLDIGWGYITLRKFIAHIYTQRAGFALGIGNRADAENLIVKAASYNLDDVTYQLLIQTQLARLNQIATDPGVSDTVRQTQFRDTASLAVSYARQATEKYPGNYANWLALGSVYETLAQYKIEGAYDEAVKAYDKALTLNLKNPAIYLMRARLDAVAGNYDSSKTLISLAISEKNNYIDAIYLLSQIQVAEGDIASAIRSIEQATLADPQNPLVYFQLGLLHYNNKTYGPAVDAFERAVALQGLYANARYFLGLSYEKLGMIDEAVAQFEELAKTNPGNQEVNLILNNLKSGRPSFTDAKPPIDDQPEKRKELPLEEKDVPAKDDPDSDTTDSTL